MGLFALCVQTAPCHAPYLYYRNVHRTRISAVPVVKDNFTLKQGLTKVLTTEQLLTHCKENLKQIFPEMKLRGPVPNSFIHVSVSDLYFPTIGLPSLLHENRWRKLEITLMIFSGAWGNMIHERNLKQNISCHCPFKGTQD